MPLPLVTSNIPYAPSDKIITVFITFIVIVIAVQVEQMCLHVHKNVDSEGTAHVWLQIHPCQTPVSPQHYHQGLFIIYHGHPDKYSKASGSDILANICDLCAVQPPQPIMAAVFIYF